MKKLFNFIIILLISLTIGCKLSRNNSSTLNDGKRIQDSSEAVRKNIELNKVQEEKRNDSIKSVQESIVNQWIGKYSYDESAESLNGITSMVWIYYLNVSNLKNDDLSAYIEIDGYQTSSRIRCRVKCNEEKMDLFFLNYGEGNLFEIYKPGDHLLALERKGSSLKTYWYKL